MKTPRVVLYLRVSTVAQDFLAQLHAMAGYCGRRGWTPGRTYQEKRPGANAPRTELDQLMKDARAGLFDVVVIYKLDRLGRSSLHLAQIVGELAALRIGIISATEGIDTTEENPMGGFVIKILSAVAELERERIRERAADGLEAARARGVKLGRPGLSAELEAEILALGFDHPERSLSVREIAQRVDVSIGKVSAVLAAARGVQETPPAKSAV